MARARYSNPATCPKCGKRARNLGSSQRLNRGQRRRECPACEHRWTSIEIPVEDYERFLRANKTLENLVIGLQDFWP